METYEIVGHHPRVQPCLTNSDAGKNPRIAGHDAIEDIVVVKSLRDSAAAGCHYK